MPIHLRKFEPGDAHGLRMHVNESKTFEASKLRHTARPNIGAFDALEVFRPKFHSALAYLDKPEKAVRYWHICNRDRIANLAIPYLVGFRLTTIGRNSSRRAADHELCRSTAVVRSSTTPRVCCRSRIAGARARSKTVVIENSCRRRSHLNTPLCRLAFPSKSQPFLALRDIPAIAPLITI